ncbi:efflux RND transporter permease subunit [Prosthecobacter fluviatilis]|uniref:Efflux RND transporter permease subunit n=1 Tax=Prosthecobacter fluviatilis TaxID=445931 RepID=A0ABW0KMF5_9BACT
MGTLTKYVLKHRPIAFALMVLFVLAGALAFNRLPVEAYPDVTNVSVQIITLLPGRAAEEVERLVTVPIENAMNSIPKRSSIRSVSLFGLSQVTIVFDDDADRAYCRNMAFQLLSSVSLPPDADTRLSPDTTPVGEIYRYTLDAPRSMLSTELRAVQDWIVERQLRTVSGVVDVIGFGGATKQYQVLIDPMKLLSYDISLRQVLDALSAGNKNAGGAYIEHGPEMFIVRGLGFVQSLEDIGQIAVETRGGTPIRVRDLGRVLIGEQLRLGRVGRNIPAENYDLDDAIEGIVMLRKGENAMEVLERVRDKIDIINTKFLPAGVHIHMHYDRTNLINRTLHTVHKNMADGIGLVLLVLILFLGLGNIRSALVVAAVVPLSLLGAFSMLDLRGIPANLISMGAIDFGIIVDSAVVVIEDLLRMMHERRDKKESLFKLLPKAVGQMGRPILFSKAILLTAFLPLYTMQRVEGKIFKPMALTLTFALVAGTILALTIVPLLASYALKKGPGEHESWLVRILVRMYRPSLDWALKHGRTIVFSGVIMLAVAGVVSSHTGTEFLPKLDEGSLYIRSFLPQTIAPSESAKIMRRMRAVLASFPESRSIITQNGRPDDGTDVNGFDVSETSVDLYPREEWKTAKDRDGLVKAMKARLNVEVPGVQFQFSQIIEDNVNEAISGVKSELSVKIFGDEPEKLQQLADQIVDILNTVPGAADVGTDRLMGQPQVQIAVDRTAISRAGLSMTDVQSVIETSMGGSVATKVLEGERTFDLVVKMIPRSVASIDGIRRIPVSGSDGERLTLGAVASVEVKPGFARIYREENARLTAVKLAVRGRDLGTLVAEAQQKVNAQVVLPKGFRLEWTGAFENQQRAVKRLILVVPITLIAIFFLLFTAFDSAKLATLILLNVPFAAVGGILVLPLAGLAMSVSALVGFIALFGVSVQNGVLLVERIRELRKEGMRMAEAVREGAISRVRPVVMTAAMAALGLLPAALSHAVGAETARPFACVIIGGLVTATLLTLFILPVLYPHFDAGEEGLHSQYVLIEGPDHQPFLSWGKKKGSEKRSSEKPEDRPPADG